MLRRQFQPFPSLPMQGVMLLCVWSTKSLPALRESQVGHNQVGHNQATYVPYALPATLVSTALRAGCRGGRWFESTAAHTSTGCFASMAINELGAGPPAGG